MSKGKIYLDNRRLLLIVLFLFLLVGLTIALSIEFTYPTLSNNNYINSDSVIINVSASDDQNISVFIDWNNSLVAWWRMDERDGSTILDYMDQIRGTLTGTFAVSDGYFGEGIELNGESYFRVDDNRRFWINTTGSMTISAWVRLNATPKSMAGIVSQAEWGYLLGTSSSQTAMIYGMDGICNYLGINNNPSFTLGKWYNVVMVTKAANQSDDYLYYYVDSKLLFSDTIPDPSCYYRPQGTQYLYIGGKGKDALFNGTVDDVMIFNRVLTQEEIIALYANISSRYISTNFTNVSEGTYTYTAYSQDTEGNIMNTGERNVTIDTFSPSIEYSSENPQTQKDNFIIVNVSASDNNAVNVITIYLFNSTSLVNSSSSTSNPYWVNFTALAAGIYYINATVNDTAGNINRTSTRMTQIDLPPLINYASSSQPLPVEFSAVYIYANISDDNNNLNWVNFTVTAPNGSAIINSENASSNSGDVWNSREFNVTAMGTWTWNVTAFDGVTTSSEAGSFTVPIWQIIVGNLSGTLTLADSSGMSLVRWVVGNVTGSKVYATDSECNINFDTLLALGRTIDNSTRVSNFEDLDVILSTSTFSDSINKSYTYDNRVREEYNLTIFEKTLYFVPITNSTDNDLFFTGILWDSSDDGIRVGEGGIANEFDPTDKEDVVFVTEVTKSAQGKYGTYDYEIRVPANLRNYISDDSLSVVLYGEIN